jgi:hypothetical protein
VYQLSRPKDALAKSYSKSTNIGSCGEFFTAANFDSLPKFELLFSCHEVLEQKPFCVNNIWYKFQDQIINKTKDINNLPTCVVVGRSGGKPFHCYQL